MFICFGPLSLDNPGMALIPWCNRAPKWGQPRQKPIREPLIRNQNFLTIGPYLRPHIERPQYPRDMNVQGILAMLCPM